MAGKSTERAEIQELIRVSDEARSQLGTKIGKYRRTLKVPSRVMGSMRAKPVAWLFGSMGSGLLASFLLSKIPRRKKKRSGLKKMAASLTLSAVRPLAKVWLTNKLRSLGSQWIAERIKPQPSPFQIEPDNNPKDVRTPGP